MYDIINLLSCHTKSYVYGCGPCCEWKSRHSSLLGRMAEVMGHALHLPLNHGDERLGLAIVSSDILDQYAPPASHRPFRIPDLFCKARRSRLSAYCSA